MRYGINSHSKKQHTLIITLIISLCVLTIVILFMFLPSVIIKEKDITAPSLSLNNDSHMIVAYGSTFSDPGASAIDNVDGDLTASIIVEGTINTSIYGKQYLTYSVTDTAGNTETIQRTVVVQEFTPPVITLTGNEVLYVPVGATKADLAFTAIDDVDGDVSDSVVLSNNVDFQTPGTYTLTYTVSDSSGNTASQSRTVNIFQPQTEEQIANASEKIVYLTFDDGPAQHTRTLLDILDKYNVDATFFVTGQNSDYYDEIGEAHRRGHTIAIHTFSHKFSEIYANETAYYNDLNKISTICESQTGEKPTIVRFPGGTSNTVSKKYCKGIMSLLTESLTANGYQYCDWNVDSDDAGSAKTSEEVAKNVINNIKERNHSIVLQHDTQLFSIEAVEEIIYWGLANGYTFLPLTKDSPMSHHPANN